MNNTEWQPIETAPKFPIDSAGNGPEIIIWHELTRKLELSHWVAHYEDDGSFSKKYGHWKNMDCLPTCWTTLPIPSNK